MVAYTSESGHWYTPDGKPAYEVPYADPSKGMRPTTLRDAKKLGLYPSVTGIIKLAAAPGLERWKQDQVLMAALTLPRNEGESDSDFISRVYRDSQEQGKQAAALGTAIHGAVEAYYQSQSYLAEYKPHVDAVTAVIRERFGDLQWKAEKSFSSPHGYGCKVDLVADGVVIDYKSKEFGPDNLPSAYDENIMQLAANAVATGQPFASMKAANVFISRNNPGLVHLVEHSQDDLSRGWKMFEALLMFWKAKNS